MFKITKLLTAFAAMTAVVSPIAASYGHTAKIAAPTTESAVNFHTTNSVAPFDDGGLANRIAAAAVLNDYYQTAQPFKNFETTSDWATYFHSIGNNNAMPEFANGTTYYLADINQHVEYNLGSTIFQPQIKFLDHTDYPFEDEYYHSYQLSWGIETFIMTGNNHGPIEVSQGLGLGEGAFASVTGYWSVNWFSQEIDTQVHFDESSQSFAIDSLTAKPISALQTLNYASNTIAYNFDANGGTTVFNGGMWNGYEAYDGFTASTGDWSQPASVNNWVNPGW